MAAETWWQVRWRVTCLVCRTSLTRDRRELTARAENWTDCKCVVLKVWESDSTTLDIWWQVLHRHSGWFTGGLARLLVSETFWRASTRIARPRNTLVTGSGQLEMRPPNWPRTQGHWAGVAAWLLQWVERGQLTESSVSEPVVEVVCEKAATNVSASVSNTPRGLNFEQGTANTATGKESRARSFSAAVATRL